MDRFRLSRSGRSVPPLELCWAELTVRRVQSPAVVEALDVIEHGGLGRCPCRETMTVHELSLERAEEALCHGVVQRVTGRSHRRSDPGLAKSAPERQGRVLTGFNP